MKKKDLINLVSYLLWMIGSMLLIFKSDIISDAKLKIIVVLLLYIALSIQFNGLMMVMNNGND
jgi:hypothetical protein